MYGAYALFIWLFAPAHTKGSAVHTLENKHSEAGILATLQKCIATPPENSRLFEFTPNIATWINENLNIGNRTKKPQKIREYADDMAAKEWGLTGATIVFGSDGRLKDGQNRLLACIQSGCNFTTHVVFGVDPALFAKMDIGKVRNAGDIFHIAKVKNGNDVSAAVRWLDILTSDNPLSRETRKPEYLLKKYEERFSKVSDSIGLARMIRRNCAHPVGNVAALHYLFSLVDQTKAEEFVNRWATGMRDGQKDPINNMQSQIMALKTINQGRIHEAVRNALIIKAWNHFFADKKIALSRMQWSLGESFPEIEGFTYKNGKIDTTTRSQSIAAE